MHKLHSFFNNQAYIHTFHLELFTLLGIHNSSQIHQSVDYFCILSYIHHFNFFVLQDINKQNQILLFALLDILHNSHQQENYLIQFSIRYKHPCDNLVQAYTYTFLNVKSHFVYILYGRFMLLDQFALLNTVDIDYQFFHIHLGIYMCFGFYPKLNSLHMYFCMPHSIEEYILIYISISCFFHYKLKKQGIKHNNH